MSIVDIILRNYKERTGKNADKFREILEKTIKEYEIPDDEFGYSSAYFILDTLAEGDESNIYEQFIKLLMSSNRNRSYENKYKYITPTLQKAMTLSDEIYNIAKDADESHSKQEVDLLYNELTDLKNHLDEDDYTYRSREEVEELLDREIREAALDVEYFNGDATSMSLRMYAHKNKIMADETIVSIISDVCADFKKAYDREISKETKQHIFAVVESSDDFVNKRDMCEQYAIVNYMVRQLLTVEQNQVYDSLPGFYQRISNSNSAVIKEYMFIPIELREARLISEDIYTLAKSTILKPHKRITYLSDANIKLIRLKEIEEELKSKKYKYASEKEILAMYKVELDESEADLRLIKGEKEGYSRRIKKLLNSTIIERKQQKENQITNEIESSASKAAHIFEKLSNIFGKDADDAEYVSSDERRGLMDKLINRR